MAVQNGSLPLRERGLKQAGVRHVWHGSLVAPLAGAWIETLPRQHHLCVDNVAPLAGAWIETSSLRVIENSYITSLPLRERGLKL